MPLILLDAEIPSVNRGVRNAQRVGDTGSLLPFIHKSSGQDLIGACRQLVVHSTHESHKSHGPPESRGDKPMV